MFQINIVTCECLLFFFFQLFQMFYQRRQYNIFENLLEWAVYVLAIVYVADEFDIPLVNR